MALCRIWSRYTRDVKFDLQFVFDFYCTPGHANWSDAKIPLLQDGVPVVASVGTQDMHRYWPRPAVQ